MERSETLKNMLFLPLAAFRSRRTALAHISKPMPNCKKCNDELTQSNCCWTGMQNFATGDRYMDNVCRECKRGLTKSSQAATGSEPGTPCACCGRMKKRHLDHDHATDQLRGFICQSCNHGLGHLGDDIEGIQRALAYLQRVG